MSGCAGYLADGRRDPSWRGRNDTRNRVFVDGLWGTGLRSQEWSSVLLSELPVAGPDRHRYYTGRVAAGVAKTRARSYWMPAGVLADLDDLAVEADVKRWVLTHKHTDLKDLFNAKVRTATQEPPLVQQLRNRVTELEAANTDLRREVARRDHALDAMARWLNLAALNPPQQETDMPQLRLHPDATPPATTQ